MKVVFKIFVAVLVLLNASTYAFWDDNSDNWTPPDPKNSKYVYLDFKNPERPWESMKIETLDLSEDFPNVERLVLHPCFTNALEKDLENVYDDMGLSNNLKLKELNINGAIFGKILSSTYLPNLILLTISHSTTDIDFSGFPNLKVLVIDSAGFTDETLIKLSQLSQLETLSFKHTGNLFNDQTIELLGQFKNLKVLHIYQKLNNPGDDKAAYIKKRLKKMLPKTEVRVGWKYNF